MRSSTFPTRALVATAALVFAAAAAAAQQQPHSVTCVDGTTDNSAAKAPCHGHGGIKPAPGAVAVNAAPAPGAVAVNTPGSTAKPKPKPAPPPASASNASLNGGTKIDSSPRDPASPQKLYAPAAAGGIGNTEVKKGAPVNHGSGGVGNTAVEKEGQMSSAAGGIGNTAVHKEGQMGKTAVPAVQKSGGIGNVEVMKEAPAGHGSGGVGATTESKAFKSTGRCKDGTYSTAKDPTTQCSSHGGVSKIYSTGATPP